MKISRAEHAAINLAVSLGKRHGYGNIMSHLASAWAETLIEAGMPESQAERFVSDRGPYPIAMHRDILERGEWDETGNRYRRKAGDA